MDNTEQAFRHTALALTEELRKRAIRQRGVRPQLDAQELTELRVTRGQLREIRLLAEEILAHWRNARLSLQRLMNHLANQEQLMQQSITGPAEALADALRLVYGDGEAG